MANTGYGACDNVNAKTREAIEDRSKANEAVGGTLGGTVTAGAYLPWMTKRKPWIRAYSCAVNAGGDAISSGLGDDSTPSLSELYSAGNRPDPGITGLSITEEGTHGGFKEAKLSFVCWNREDFSPLAIAFLTYGMTVTVEYGWSVNASGTTVSKNSFSGTRCKDDDGTFAKAIRNHSNQNECCYDAVRGHVTDFSWAIGANGSFECECTFTSMAGNTAKAPIKIATKDCSCEEDAPDGETPEKGPTWNIVNIIDQYIEECSEDKAYKKSSDGVFTGLGITAEVDKDSEGADRRFPWQDYTANFNYVTFEAFEEHFVNHQVQSIANDAGAKGTTRDQAKTILEVDKVSGFTTSGNAFMSLFYSNHSVIRAGKKEIASGDPRVCLLPGSGLQQLTIDEFPKNSAYSNFPSCFASDGIYLSRILLNLAMLKEEFNNCGPNTGAGEYMKRVLERVNEACGGIWNFTMVPSNKAENIIQWLDIDKSQKGVTSIEIPSYGKKSIVRSISSQTDTDPDFQAQIMYGANNKSGKGGGNKSGGISLWAGGYKDEYADSIRVSSECTEDDYKSQNCTPKSGDDIGDNETQDEASVETIMTNLGQEVSPDSVAAATRCMRTQALGDTPSDTGDTSDDVRVIPIPISLSVEIDGIAGFTFGNLITSDYLPAEYDGFVFQITKVEHNVSNADWSTKLECGFMRKL